MATFLLLAAFQTGTEAGRSAPLPAPPPLLTALAIPWALANPSLERPFSSCGRFLDGGSRPRDVHVAALPADDTGRRRRRLVPRRGWVAPNLGEPFSERVPRSLFCFPSRRQLRRSSYPPPPPGTGGEASRSAGSADCFWVRSARRPVLLRRRRPTARNSGGPPSTARTSGRDPDRSELRRVWRRRRHARTRQAAGTWRVYGPVPRGTGPASLGGAGRFARVGDLEDLPLRDE